MKKKMIQLIKTYSYLDGEYMYYISIQYFGILSQNNYKIRTELYYKSTKINYKFKKKRFKKLT